MNILQYLEIFTLATGVVYVILEILQKNSMWILGFFSALAAAIVFFSEKLFASAGLNTYYVIVSVIGYYTWHKDSRKLKHRQKELCLEEKETSQKNIHLNKPTYKTIIYSTFILIAGTVALYFILKYLGDPMGCLDAYVTVLSAIATVWLAKSYISQWWLWVVADMFSTALCFIQGIPWMGLLYLIYALSAIYGYFHWKKNGVIVGR